ncbi:MAG TPA: helix-turn-helix domain-containing protein [Bacteroidetes bacterium]|nr:helix-turn-helix domain-containing protein [Bacteroidota bacterium]HEX04930.1 helix-turn-helix domain-containing protein [Bacteroidota bacterium]
MAKPKFRESKIDFCKDLISAREYKELDLAKVSERTKISLEYLQNLENGDWEFLPVSYVRAFMRTYAQSVGMDVGDVLQRYDSIIGNTPDPPPKMADSPLKPSRAESGKNRNLKFTLADDSGGSSSDFKLTVPMIYAGIAVIVIAVLLLLWFYVISPKIDGNDQSNVQEIPFDEVVRETQTAVNPDSQAADSLDSSPVETSGALSTSTLDPAHSGEDDVIELSGAELREDQPLAADLLTLTADVRQPCYMWVMMDHDTSEVFDTILSSGTIRSFEADSVFRVVVGNTNVVSLSLNGRELRDIGRLGRVVTFTIDATGVREAQAGNRELR